MPSKLIKIIMGIFIFPSIMYAPSNVNSASAAAASASSSSSSGNMHLKYTYSASSNYVRANNNKKLLNLFSTYGLSPIIFSVFDFALESISKYDPTFIELVKMGSSSMRMQLDNYLESKNIIVKSTIDQMLKYNSLEDFDMKDELDVWKRLPLLRNILINIARDASDAQPCDDILYDMRSQGFFIEHSWLNEYDAEEDDAISAISKKTDREIKGIIYYSINILRALIMSASNYQQGDILEIDTNMDEHNKQIYNQTLKDIITKLIAEGDNVYEFLSNSEEMIFKVIFSIILFENNFDKKTFFKTSDKFEFMIHPIFLHSCCSLEKLLLKLRLEWHLFPDKRQITSIALNEISNNMPIDQMSQIFEKMNPGLIEKSYKRSMFFIINS